jgi:hypothetical protein
VLGSKFEVPFNLLNGIPKLGASGRDRFVEEIPSPKILSTDDVRPETIRVLVQLPNPFEHQSDVHEFGVEDSQSSKRFGFTNRSPIHHVVLAFVAHSFPKEASPGSVHGFMGAVEKHVQAHGKLREAG